MKTQTKIVVLVIILIALNIANFMIKENRKSICMNATGTPNYELINGQLHCELPSREWVQVEGF